MAYMEKTPHAVAVVGGYTYMPIAVILSSVYFGRKYGLLEWLSVFMMTLAVCTYMALRERYHAGGTEAAVAELRAHVHFSGMCIVVGSAAVSAFASVLAERLFKVWAYEAFYVLKVNIDLVSTCLSAGFWAAGVNFHGVSHLFGDQRRLSDNVAESPWYVEWDGPVMALAVATVAHAWLAGLVTKKESTVTKSVIASGAVVTMMLISDPLRGKFNFAVRMWPATFLVVIAWISLLTFQTGRLNIQLAKQMSRDDDAMLEDVDHAGAPPEQNEASPGWFGSSPWRIRQDPEAAAKASEEKILKQIEQATGILLQGQAARQASSQGDGLSSEAIVYSLVYIVMDAGRTMLNQYALSSSQINPNSMSFMTFALMLIWFCYQTLNSGYLALQSKWDWSKFSLAWKRDALWDYLPSAFFMAITTCFVNMSYALGLSSALAVVLGKVYTPVLAIGERVYYKRSRLWIEWFAIAILTLAVFTFGYLSSYKIETGLDLSNSVAIVLSLAGATTAAIGALVSDNIYKQYPVPPTTFPQHQIRFNFGSLFFTVLVVPFLSLTASRAKDIVWLHRPVDTACAVPECWPHVTAWPSGSLHWPWAADMDTCPADLCVDACACEVGLFAGWGSTYSSGWQPALYLFLLVNILYSIITGKVMQTCGALHRAKCDAFSLVLLYWLGNPLLEKMLNGTPLSESLKDMCLNIVSLIVPLAAVAIDVGKSEMKKIRAERTLFRAGLIARLWSVALGGREVSVVICDPPREGEECGEGRTIPLADQRPSAGKRAAFIQLQEPPERRMQRRWLGKVTELVNAEDWQLTSSWSSLAQCLGVASATAADADEAGAVSARVKVASTAKAFPENLVTRACQGARYDPGTSPVDADWDSDSSEEAGAYSSAAPSRLGAVEVACSAPSGAERSALAHLEAVCTLLETEDGLADERRSAERLCAQLRRGRAADVTDAADLAGAGSPVLRFVLGD
eukprot:TRINITY_DN31079_c0_g1_i1.p1 TRINITY_DN31079_c0_g1~~TRINITY_DN31079_c0_g1_i1.p1  ORF type:complete len:1098 (-),score=203.62 TRINITY_DN31079_c0_g1_i1:153-3050(-)